MIYGVLTFGFVMLLAIWMAFRNDERLDDFYQRIIGVELEREEGESKSRVRTLVRILMNMIPFSPSKEYVAYWDRKLMQAGHMYGWKSGLEFFFLRLAHGLLGCCLAYLTKGEIHGYVILGGLGFYFPAAVIRGRILQRREKARPVFRKMLKLLETQLDNGDELSEAIQKAGEAVDEPLRSVFKQAGGMLKNESIHDVLTWVSQQFDFPELRKFCVLVIVASDRGTSFKQVVQEMIRSMDENVGNDIEVAIGKSKLKILFAVIFCTIIPFAFGSVIILGTHLMTMLR